jgi:hypothetical protein
VCTCYLNISGGGDQEDQRSRPALAKKKNVSKILSQRKRWALAVSIGLPSNGGKCKIGGPWYRAAGAKKRDPVSKVTRAK